MRSFINPYNFVSFGVDESQKSANEEVTNKIDKRIAYFRDEGKEGEQKYLYSGWLGVRLYIKTPLIIPDGAHPETEIIKKYDEIKRKDITIEHKSFTFLGYESGSEEKTYIIPGSSLRGMIRNVYEALTDSCIPFLTNDKPMSHRVPLYASLHRRGLLGYNEKRWVLYEVEQELEEVTVSQIEPKEKNHFQFTSEGGTVLHSNNRMEKTGSWIEEKKAYLQYNVPVNLKEKYHVAYLKPLKEKPPVYKWPESSDPRQSDAYIKLKSALVRDGVETYDKKTGKRDNKQRNRDCNRALDEALEEACKNTKKLVPVYYFFVEDEKGHKIYYLSGSSAGRIAQRRKWADIIGSYKPCTNELCPACLLFGTLAEGGMRGHIRFSDAILEGEAKKTKRTLKILATPKATAFEFYLKRPKIEATYWNYDFYGETEECEDGHYRTKYYHLVKAMLRGRKMYWHHDIDSKNEDKGKMNSTVESIDAGTFSFKVYFDQVTEQQLRDLMWAISLGDNSENSKYQHKLGHARPLGYGSVKLVIEEGKIRLFIKEGKNFCMKLVPLDEVGIKIDKIDEKLSFGLESKRVRELLKIHNVESVSDALVDYPRITDNGKIYEWFTKNRKSAEELKTLPEPLDERLTLQ